MKNEILRKKYKTVGHARHTDRLGSFTPRGVLCCSALGAAASLVCGILLGLVMALVLYRTADPARYVTPAALSVLYVSALLGGTIAYRANKRSALLCGAISGAILLAIMLLVSLPFGIGSSDHGIISALTLRALVIAASVVGAFMGAIEPSKKKRKNYKKR